MKGCVISAPMTGSGKTTVTLGLLETLRKRGLAVQPFKVGPDFIDPGLHEIAAGVPSHNLDGWMFPRGANEYLFGRAIEGKDVTIVEGVMGLFDGYDGKSEAGSTAEMAKWLGLPVILVVDASAMARSVAALIHGFQSFDPDLQVAGVIFNRIGGSGHLQYLREALQGRSAITILGGLPHNERIAIPERHLGLVTQEEHSLTPERIAHLASFIEDNLDLAQLLQISEVQGAKCKVQSARSSDFALCTLHFAHRKGVRFGVARDEAFCFYYPDNLELLE